MLCTSLIMLVPGVVFFPLGGVIIDRAREPFTATFGAIVMVLGGAAPLLLSIISLVIGFVRLVKACF